MTLLGDFRVAMEYRAIAVSVSCQLGLLSAGAPSTFSGVALGLLPSGVGRQDQPCLTDHFSVIGGDFLFRWTDFGRDLGRSPGLWEWRVWAIWIRRHLIELRGGERICYIEAQEDALSKRNDQTSLWE